MPVENLPLESLFSTLKAADYYWSPLSPERWMKCRESARENPAQFDPWVRCFGLGLEVPECEFETDFPGFGFSDFNNITRKTHGMISSLLGVSRGADDIFTAHSHWGNQESPAYIGQETATLIDCMKENAHEFQGKKILDLGCGAGALSLSVARAAHSVLGLDRSESATRLASASARAQGFHHLDFQPLAIGTSEAENYVRARGPWNTAVMNPPMAIPEQDTHFMDAPSARPERDGGQFGIELPLLFLDFAHAHLHPSATLFMLATNPVTKRSSEGLFFESLHERLRSRLWTLDESTCLGQRFNQSLARKHHYAEQGIERIELWYLKLIRH